MQVPRGMSQDSLSGPRILVMAKEGSFRRARQRASRACEVCHMRKVRCDVTVHKPCTNCVAFGCECRVPEAKARRKPRDEFDGEEEPISDEEVSWVKPNLHPPDSSTTIYMGSASFVPFFRDDEEVGGTNISRSYPHMTDLHSHITRDDISVLKIKGAFNLPPKHVCDKLVAAYFERVHPMLPLLNHNQFMRRYNDPKDQPSLLLLQSVFCCAVHLCKDEEVVNIAGSLRKTIEMFYTRAKALFDSGYEHDRVTSLQSALVLSLALDSPDRINNNIFYWCRVAVTLAQSMGLHRWLPRKQQTVHQQRLFKRIWWCLFVRDRSSATAYGRPTMINLEDSDVPMVVPEDFIEDEGEILFPPQPQAIEYFIHTIKLHEIMGLVLRQQYSVGAERLRLENQLPDVTQCDIALATWINNVPDGLRYSIKEINRHSFLSALIYLQYYTVLCLAHRPQVVHFSRRGETPYPSWGIAFQAAHMIVRIFENLRHFDEVQILPAFCIYTSFSALIMLAYQTESQQEAVSHVAEKAMASLLKDVQTMGTVYESANEIATVAQRMGRGKKRPLQLLRRTEQAQRSERQKLVKLEEPPVGPPAPTPAPSAGPSAGPGEVPAVPSAVGAPAPASAPGPGHTLTAPLASHAPMAPPELYPAPEMPVPSPRDLCMVTQSQDNISSFEPQLLFPETESHGLEPLFNAERDMTSMMGTPHSHSSSGDEQHGPMPESLSMNDWYDFLMTNQDYEQE